MKKIVTTNHKLHVARQLLESVSEVANTAYYLFVGDHTPRVDSTIPEIYNTPKDIFVDPYKNMIMGKRLNESDLALMIRNIPYESGKNYAHYDDDDYNLPLKDFYCSVDEGSYTHVYLCIDNNSNSITNTVSTVQPEFVNITGSNNSIFETSDGYRWKYMYSVSSSLMKKFATTEYIPVIANNVTSENAVDGSIDFIKVTSGGKGYDNYIYGKFDNPDIKFLGDPYTFKISNSSFHSTYNFYAGCLLYLSDGTGSGQHVKVESSHTNSLGSFIITSNTFNIFPDSTTYYQITPGVKITSDGSETISAVARALVNTYSSNSISKIEILDSGAGYDYYVAEVIPPAKTPNLVEKEAELRTISSPAGGHGKDVASELYSSRLCFSIKLQTTEANTILVSNEFKQIGILKDPIFSNVSVSFSNSYGSLVSNPSEMIYKINPKRFNIGININTISSNVTCTTADFTSQVIENDLVYITSEDKQDHMLASIRNIHNNSTIELNTNGYFNSTNASIYYANISSSAYVSNVNASNVYLSNVSGVISSGDVLIGIDSGGLVEVESVYRNDINKTFVTFIQLYKYKATIQTGNFKENELIYMSNSDSTAYVHSVQSLGGDEAYIYTSNQIGQFDVGKTVFGNTSGAVANIISIYTPELVFGSGDILYIENTEAFTRDRSQSEIFKIIFEF